MNMAWDFACGAKLTGCLLHWSTYELNMVLCGLSRSKIICFAPSERLMTSRNSMPSVISY